MEKPYPSEIPVDLLFHWNLTIDEFAGCVANEGSVKTLAHVFSEGRKFKMSMTVAHQDLSQLTLRMLGALRVILRLVPSLTGLEYLVLQGQISQ